MIYKHYVIILASYYDTLLRLPKAHQAYHNGGEGHQPSCRRAHISTTHAAGRQKVQEGTGGGGVTVSECKER